MKALEGAVCSINGFEPFVNHGQIYEPQLHTSATFSQPDAISEESLAFSAQPVPRRLGNTGGFSRPTGLIGCEYLDPQFRSIPQTAIPSTTSLSVPDSGNQYRGHQSNVGQSRGHPFPAAQPDPNEITLIPPQSPDGWDTIRHLVQEDNNLSETLKARILRNDITLHDILRSGLRFLAYEDLSTGRNPTSDHDMTAHDGKKAVLRTDKILLLRNLNTHLANSLPDIHKNNIRMKQFLFVAALAANAESLGLTFDNTTPEDAMSHFFRASVSEEVAKTSCTSEFSNLKRNLQPCVSQIMYSHHPYIDLLPFPTFRERVIKLTCTETPMIDENELCSDLQNDGLICWGSSLGGGSSATGSGSPWDIRSWEAQPWFLKKWWIVLGGADGEIYKQTQWWCEVRGNRSPYPW